jgi:putative CocE/NonD family hydrolase
VSLLTLIFGTWEGLTEVTDNRSKMVTIDRDVAVPMRDGVTLRADVYQPAQGGPWPVIVERTPYSKGLPGAQIFRAFEAIDRGYALVIQDVRGRYASEGDWEPFRGEGADGYDTVEWVAEQSWCDGAVAVSGASYLAMTSLQTAVAAPPHLRCAIAYLCPSNYFDGYAYCGGAFELGDKLKWAASQSKNALDRAKLSVEQRAAIGAGLEQLAADPWAAVRKLPIRDALPGHRLVGQYWDDWLDHSRYDAYWEAVDCVRHANAVQVPVLHIAGWYDGFLKGHVDLERALRERSGEAVRDQHRFIIGPWEHESYLGQRPSFAGVRNFGPRAVGGIPGLSRFALGWFDRWTKDPNAGSGTDAPAGHLAHRVRYFAMGENEWREEDHWPPPSEMTSFFLDSEGSANTRGGDGRLVGQVPDAEVEDTYAFDPLNPVPSCGGRFMAYQLGPGGVQDQRAIEERPDVLVYTSASLERDVVVAGPVGMRLFVASTGLDTDFTAKLVEVTADGPVWNVAEGVLRCRYRQGFDVETFLVPGEVTEIEIDLWDTAYRFSAGSQIRVEISSSNFPRFDRNPNTGQSVADAGAADFQVAQQRVAHGPAHPSCLVLSMQAG